MIDEIIYSSPLGSSDHCGLEFAFKCYYELKENKSERWNYFKGDYDNMKNELNQDWDNLLNGKSTSQQLEIFMNIINEAKNKYVPQTNSKAKSKAKKYKFIPLDDKTIKKIKKKHRCWQRYMETKDSKKYQEYIKMRNQVKGLVRKAKENMEKEIAENAEKKSEKILAIRKFKEKNKIWNIRTDIQERKRGG